VGTPYWSTLNTNNPKWPLHSRSLLHLVAPEVIEIEGHSFKSDVWYLLPSTHTPSLPQPPTPLNNLANYHIYCGCRSVGCLVCEFITGKPPYYELPPMAAIFQIVGSAHPPLPEGLSEVNIPLYQRTFLRIFYLFILESTGLFAQMLE